MAAETAPPLKIVHLMISGRVQGVSYRVWMQREAQARGISGWARNRANGDVEALVSGSPEAVQSLCEICRSGPPASRVDQILIGEASRSALDLMGPKGSFNILPTL
jgi:acylphosphatase